MIYFNMQIHKQIRINTLIQDLNWEKTILFSMYSLSILIPLIISKPQLLVGSMINFLIVYSSLKYGIKRTLPILILPSITAYLTGLLFSGATHFLLYITPFIILSNFFLSVFVSKKTKISYISAIIVKGSFLVIIFFVMNKLPKELRTARKMW